MDFGVGFLSNNVMLPILDFFYGIVPSYGLAIIFLTLVIRFALYPLNVGSIRNMRRMKVISPVMQRRMRELQEKYRDDPQKLREAQAKLYSELGANPLGGLPATAHSNASAVCPVCHPAGIPFCSGDLRCQLADPAGGNGG